MAAELLRRARRRRQRRGAAATEGVIIATFFVFIFACMWGALTFHWEKVRVMKEARAQVWMYALNNCSGSGGTTVNGGDSFMNDIASNAGNAGNNGPPGEANNQFGNVTDSSLNDDAGYAQVEVTGSVTMPGLIGGKSYVPTGKMYVRCNEEPADDNILDIAKKAMGIAKDLFSLTDIF